MTMTDPLADLMTRIRNAQKAAHPFLTAPSSHLKKAFLDVLIREGYIQGYEETQVRPSVFIVKVFLKYYNQTPVIQEIQRVSKPGRRVYVGLTKLTRLCNSFGIYIVSTSKGIFSDKEARHQNAGGELLCKVF